VQSRGRGGAFQSSLCSLSLSATMTTPTITCLLPYVQKSRPRRPFIANNKQKYTPCSRSRNEQVDRSLEYGRAGDRVTSIDEIDRVALEQTTGAHKCVKVDRVDCVFSTPAARSGPTSTSHHGHRRQRGRVKRGHFHTAVRQGFDLTDQYIAQGLSRLQWTSGRISDS